MVLAAMVQAQDVYVSNYASGLGSAGSVIHYSARGQYLGSLSVPNEDLDGGIALDAKGDLYVASFNIYSSSDLIREFSPTGKDLGNFATNADGVSSPRGIAFDTDYNLYVANYSSSIGGYIEKYSSTGKDLGIFAQGLQVPDGIVYHDGVLYVADQGNSLISEYSTNGTYLSGFTTLHGHNGSIAIGPDGDLYTVPIFSALVDKYTLSGQFLGTVVVNPNWPIGVAVNPEGDIYEYGGLVNYNTDTDEIHRYSPTGQDLGIFATTGLNAPQFLVFAVPEPDTRLFGVLSALSLLFLYQRRSRRQTKPRLLR
jgi:hypothetical protein